MQKPQKESVKFTLSLVGSGDRNRTCDTGLMSPLLYRLSYAALHRLERPI